MWSPEIETRKKFAQRRRRRIFPIFSIFSSFFLRFSSDYEDQCQFKFKQKRKSFAAIFGVRVLWKYLKMSSLEKKRKETKRNGWSKNEKEKKNEKDQFRSTIQEKDRRLIDETTLQKKFNETAADSKKSFESSKNGLKTVKKGEKGEKI